MSAQCRGLEAFVALGANLGDPAHTILQAIDRLAELSELPLRKSSLWQTAPIDCPPGSPPFVNAVVALVPGKTETPQSLLARLQALELEFGRQRSGQTNEPRLLDLDLIAFGMATIQTDPLTLPHPRAARRRFVLQPLAELAPDFVLPGQAKTVLELLAELDSSQLVTRLQV